MAKPRVKHIANCVRMYLETRSMARLVCGSVLVLSFSLSVRAADGTSLVDDLVWNRYRSPANGVLLTLIDDNARPSPLTVNGSPRAFEASAISTALYLDALVVRNQGPRAREVLGALLKLSLVSGVPGLIARGVYPNGKPYSDPSYLDYAVLHYAFWRYYNSPIASE